MMKTKLNVYQFMFMFPKLQSRNSSAKGGYLRLPQIMLCNISKKRWDCKKPSPLVGPKYQHFLQNTSLLGAFPRPKCEET